MGQSVDCGRATLCSALSFFTFDGYNYKKQAELEPKGVAGF